MPLTCGERVDSEDKDVADKYGLSQSVESVPI